MLKEDCRRSDAAHGRGDGRARPQIEGGPRVAITQRALLSRHTGTGWSGGGGGSGTRGRTDPDGAERPPGRPQEVTQEALHVCAKALGRVCCAVCSRKTNGCLGTS